MSEETAKENEIELKRYLTLCAFSRLPYGMGGDLDDLWHTFIIFTKMYSDFCINCFGRFIHHSPNEDVDQSRDDSLVYLNFFAHYSEVVGALPPRHIWAYPSNQLLKRQDLNKFAYLFTDTASSENDLLGVSPRPSGTPTCSRLCSCHDGKH